MGSAHSKVNQEATMRPGLFGTIVACASCIVAASPADALICYIVYNRSENIVYQDTYPPVDMSNAGLAQREGMRARGEHMTFGDTGTCPQVVFVFGQGGTTDLRVDEVVAGMPVRNLLGAPPTGVISRGASGTAWSPGDAAGSQAAPAAAPKAAGKSTLKSGY
jgi:hypothetical protein